MPLTLYKRKRNFQLTPEPIGQPNKTPATTLSFTVQKHDASRLHYDFRLEMDGVLRSWAVPKGPSLSPQDRRLAVEVEDHPLEYGSFEGVIPKPQYGGGTVLLWDRGTWSPINGDPAVAYRAGNIKFDLFGEKLKGRWALIRMHGGEPGLKSNWLLIKETDAFVAKRGKGDITSESALSVATGRDLKQIAAGAPSVADPASTPVGRKNRPVKKTAGAAAATNPSPAAGGGKAFELPAGAKKAAMPRDVDAQLCTLADSVPEGAQWRHEVKFDGYRLLAFIEAGTVKLVTRSGLDWTQRFPELAETLKLVPSKTAILDGEVVALNNKGISDFGTLQNNLKQAATAKLTYFVFDLLYLEGSDLRSCTLDQRYATLQALMVNALTAAQSKRVRTSEHIDGNGEAVMKHACRLHLEGIVSKRSDSPYLGGRNSSWIKVKCGNRQEFVVGGYSDPQRSRTGFGALLLGHFDLSKNFLYAGKVGAGFDERSLKDLSEQLNKIGRSTSPFATPLNRTDARGAHWVKPKLVAEVDFTQWTRDGKLRHPVYRGLRTDKPALEIVRERPNALPRAEHAQRAAKRERSKPAKTVENVERPPTDKPSNNTVLDVTITHPQRVVYPLNSITKLDVARYYAAAAAWMMPHIEKRPLSLVRCPSGAGGSCFFNKHLPTRGLKGLKEVLIRESKGARPYIVVAEAAGLVSLAQMNTLELHSWGSSTDELERPDRLIFDLDPGENVQWRDIVTAAERVREILNRVKMMSFVKTTGGKGLHVLSPLKPQASWDEVKSFSKAIARLMEEKWPLKYISTMSKAKRQGKVFIDYLRNERGGTTVAAYSSRAREGGTVSMPVEWPALAKLKPTAFTILTVPSLLHQRARDPWDTYQHAANPLPNLNA